MSPPNPMIQEEAGEHAVFLATSDRYAVRGGLVPVPAGLNRNVSGEGHLSRGGGNFRGEYEVSRGDCTIL
jgi:hypothetical protein